MTMTTSKPIALACMCHKRARSKATLKEVQIPRTRCEYQHETRTGGGGLTVGSVRGAGDDGELAAGVDVLEHGLFEPREVAVALLEQRLDPIPRHRAKVDSLRRRRWRSGGEGGIGERFKP
jgi:hypothetical protein